jgi:hypothetical protein
MTLIEIKPHPWGWKVFEAPGVEPVFLEKRQAINYAEGRASFRSGEIRILDSSGNVDRTIEFSEAGPKSAPIAGDAGESLAAALG